MHNTERMNFVKQEWKPMSWIVRCSNYNAQCIEQYDILKHYETTIKKLKKKCATKEEFAKELRSEMMYHYWSRCEWELIIEIDGNNRIWLNPWVGYKNKDDIRIDVTEDASFDWRGFAELHISKQNYKNCAKIDVWNQIEYQWEDFVTYCWEYRHKWQREKREGM